ncbi:hypothetical protein F4801DRAFT_437866 [Xylaria longipes]|nr:hypothetical protein F4801DRAFT_437866 [Xylaria longipes]
MRIFPVLAALSFTILVEAQNFSSYVPECAPPCVEQTLNSSKVCTGLDDNKCLCTNFQQIIFPSIRCFMQTCNNTNVNELRSEVISGWQKFCNDSGSPVDVSGPGSPGPSSPATSSVTPSISLISSPTSSSTASSDTVPSTSSDLSTGAKAGIGVGVGIGSLAVIGGLVFLGFRLGQQKRRGGRNEAEGTSPSNEGGHPEDGRGTANTTAEGGGEHWAYKVQPEGIAELPSPEVELPANDVRELAAYEHPAELWHGVMPHELSADMEVPRDRTARF